MGGSQLNHLLHIWLGGVAVMAIVLPMAGCSSPTARERIDAARASAHHSSAADSMDSFWLDNRSPPERDVKHWEFYYKHCTVNERKRYMDNAEYMCTEPF